MLIEEKGIIISVKKFQETSFIIKCLLEKSGLIAGLYKVRKSKFIQEPIVGSIVQAKWQARLEEHLGFFSYELIKNTVALISGKKLPVLILDSAVNLINILIAEKEPSSNLYCSLKDILIVLENDYPELDKLVSYIKFEIFELLGNSGFGLDLTQCVVTNSKENLAYISPKSAAAVSLEVGKPYDAKLFKLPRFLLNNSDNCSLDELKEAYKISLYFLDKHLLKPLVKPLPLARRLLQEHILQQVSSS